MLNDRSCQTKHVIVSRTSSPMADICGVFEQGHDVRNLWTISLILVRQGVDKYDSLKHCRFLLEAKRLSPMQKASQLWGKSSVKSTPSLVDCNVWNKFLAVTDSYLRRQDFALQAFWEATLGWVWSQRLCPAADQSVLKPAAAEEGVDGPMAEALIAAQMRRGNSSPAFQAAAQV